MAKRKTIKIAAQAHKHDDPWYVFAAPTHKQAKRIYWHDLKKLVPSWMRANKPSESELTIRLLNGAEITVLGVDAPERIEGRSLDGIVLDEYGNMKPEAWTENIRPALTDRLGWAWFIGVPEGRNHYYDLDLDARACKDGTWESHNWWTEDVLPLYLGEEAAEAEIAQARKELDELTFNQEYRAEFVTFTGRAYYAFGKHNVGECRYDPERDLIFCFDFNVSPGVAAVVQEFNDVTHVIGEVWIPRGSNTVRVCDKLRADWAKHPGRVLCYGDATGGARHSSQVRGSDWEIIYEELNKSWPGRVYRRLPKANPPERVRVNAVNARCKSADGSVRLRVDPTKAKHVVMDFEGVCVLEGTNGELDKKGDSKLTHVTDAIGYYVQRAHPLNVGRATVEAI